MYFSWRVQWPFEAQLSLKYGGHGELFLILNKVHKCDLRNLVAFWPLLGASVVRKTNLSSSSAPLENIF